MAKIAVFCLFLLVEKCHTTFSKNKLSNSFYLKDSCFVKPVNIREISKIFPILPFFQCCLAVNAFEKSPFCTKLPLRFVSIARLKIKYAITISLKDTVENIANITLLPRRDQCFTLPV